VVFEESVSEEDWQGNGLSHLLRNADTTSSEKYIKHPLLKCMMGEEINHKKMSSNKKCIKAFVL
jgi:hypothetical protein